ncbi:MltE Soluble lytic murein transglycosylase and related regulatory proteins (some contain LysM/invasin domains) [Oxalobacteraceae bacterium]|jgi:soluble lytic murein transglycosylase-like protein
MNHRRIFAALVGAGSNSPLVRNSISGTEGILDKFRTAFAAARHTLALIGLAALAALALVFFRPSLLDEIKELSPFAPTSDQRAAEEIAFAELLELPQPKYAGVSALEQGANLSTEQQRVNLWLSKRYRIAGTASTLLVGAAYEAAETVKVDPLLILAVMAIESRFNPFAESAMGAQGLMQVMSRVHREKFDNHGGPTAALNPVANIQVGARILKDMIRVSGSVQGGLKLYVGAGNLETDGGYAAKVLAEYSRLQQVAAGKRVPTFTPPQVVEPAREADAAPVVSHAEQEPA